MGKQLTKPKWTPEMSDGCTMWPDWDYRDICLRHDEKYYYGGTWRQRLSADWALAKAVTKRGHWLVGPMMLVGTRIGGCVLWPYHWHWGKPEKRKAYANLG